MSFEAPAMPRAQSEIEAQPVRRIVEAPKGSEPVITVSDLGKMYRVYAKPQDRLKQAFLRWRKSYYREFWAVRNVSFEVQRGEAVGILGRNGAGKSTMLQVIAGTMAPTEGTIAVRGRTAAMLQLGSGFNPEFTGRENVFLGGAILGIGRKEMESRFDDIASFADIGSFIDQPLKTYSSGMAARLAFAVSFSVEPDLLIVDEILAVGDVGFQQKCVARLRKMRDNGLTMLFVSHSPDAVRSICQKALLLVKGRSVFFGPSERATDLYLSHIREQTNQEAVQEQTELAAKVAFKTDVPGQLRYGTGHVQIEQVRVLNHRREPTRAFQIRDRIILEATVRSQIDTANLNLSFLVRDMTGVDLMGTTCMDEDVVLPAVKAGQSFNVWFEFENNLRAGNFGVCLAVNRVSRPDRSDVVLLDQIDGCASFIVIADPKRRVHYKFHQPVQISFDAPRDGAGPVTGIGPGSGVGLGSGAGPAGGAGKEH